MKVEASPCRLQFRWKKIKQTKISGIRCPFSPWFKSFMTGLAAFSRWCWSTKISHSLQKKNSNGKRKCQAVFCYAAGMQWEKRGNEKSFYWYFSIDDQLRQKAAHSIERELVKQQQSLAWGIRVAGSTPSCSHMHFEADPKIFKQISQQLFARDLLPFPRPI